MFSFLSKKSKSVFDIFEDDVKILPDNSFVVDKIHSDENKTYFIKLCLENKYLGLFSFLTIIQFNNSSGKNFVFKCEPYEFDKYDLPEFIKKLIDILGKDDDGKGLYTRDDANQIDDNFWMGRSWTSNENESCMLNYNDEEGLSFTIWTS